MDLGDNRLLRPLVAAACFVIIIAGMRAASGILVPFLLAVFISIISTPFLVGLQRLGIPNVIAIVSILFVIIVCGLMLVGLVGASITDLTINLPEYEDRVQEETREIILRVQQWGFQIPEEEAMAFIAPRSIVQNFGGMLKGMGNSFSSAFLVLIMVLFMLTEAAGFPNKFRRFVDDDQQAESDLYKAVAEVRHYMAIKTVVSFLTAALVFVVLMLNSVSYPLLWGLLAFLFNFVPSIGSIIAAVPPIAMAFIERGMWPAAYVAMGYLVVNVTLGNIIEPRIVGYGLGLSPLIVILSLFFWGWVLGPVGMLLSVPLTMTVKIAMDSHEQTRGLAILLGPDPKHERKAAAPAQAASKAV